MTASRTPAHDAARRGPRDDAPRPDDWDAAAAGWNVHAPLIRQWLRAATDTMLDAAGIAPGMRVLDVAAGAGDQTIDIAVRVGPQGSVHAVDRSPAILALARQAMREHRLDNVDTSCADAQALALDGAGFDAAVSRLGLMFCTEPLRALQSIGRALAPGRRLAFLVFAGPQANPCVATTMAIARRYAARAAGGAIPAADPFAPGTLFSLADPQRLSSMMIEAGFDDVAVAALDAPMQLACCADYLRFLRDAASPIIALLAPLDAAARDAAWRDIDTALSVYATAEGWRGPNTLLCCSGSSRPG